MERRDTHLAMHAAARNASRSLTHVLTMREHAFAASAALADERGVLPAYDPAAYLTGPAYRMLLPLKVHHAIARHGLRNNHMLSFPPAGSVSLAFCDNCSNGIEPAVGWTQRRMVRTVRKRDGPVCIGC